MVAIRENQLRATFQGYPVERYKLAAFVISAVVTGLAGALLGFQTYLVSPKAVSVPFSVSLLADGRDRHASRPGTGARRASSFCFVSCSRSGRRTGSFGSA